VGAGIAEHRKLLRAIELPGVEVAPVVRQEIARRKVDSQVAVKRQSKARACFLTATKRLFEK
jgi:hypothetical protein